MKTETIAACFRQDLASRAVDAKDLLKLIATPGDAAAVTLGFVVGLPIDYFLLHMGVPSLTVSGYAAATAFGLKKSAEATFSKAVARRRPEPN